MTLADFAAGGLNGILDQVYYIFNLNSFTQGLINAALPEGETPGTSYDAGQMVNSYVPVKEGDALTGYSMQLNLAAIAGDPDTFDTVDISIRVDVFKRDRKAVVTASELSGKPVCFLTGVNYHPGQTVKCGDGFIFAWGVHPADVSASPGNIGAGMFYSPSDFGPMEVTGDMVRIVSKPKSSVSTTVVAASTKEAELNTLKRFEAYMTGH